MGSVGSEMTGEANLGPEGAPTCRVLWLKERYLEPCVSAAHFLWVVGTMKSKNCQCEVMATTGV